MKKVIIVGGGWAGVSAALTARKSGADVLLLEKTDMLLGAGNAGGIFRNNGRYTAAEEMKALGAGELFDIMDECAVHSNITFPGHMHASLYDVGSIEPKVRRLLNGIGIKIMTNTHVMGAHTEDGVVTEVRLDDSSSIKGDAFIDAAGTSGPMGNCLRYGNGCAMCVQRCPSFGPRVSITAACGIKDLVGRRADGTPGVFSGACKIEKKSLSEEIRNQLDKEGVVIVQLPAEDIDYEKLGKKACKQYALKEYSENLILLDTGEAKLMTSFYPLEKLRAIKGLENAVYCDPCAGSQSNSVRYLAVAPCHDTMQAEGIKNLFCGGEKGAPLIGHTEAIVTGALAGYNAVCYASGQEQLTLPDTLATGLIISHSHERFVRQKNYDERFTFSGGDFFTLMKEHDLYTTDVITIADRVEKAGLKGVFEKNNEQPYDR